MKFTLQDIRIAFTVVALLICFLALHISWLIYTVRDLTKRIDKLERRK